MNSIDILIASVIVLCLGLGVFTGFVWQVTGILSVVLGILAALILGPATSEAMQRWIDNPHACDLLAYLGIFAVVSVALRVFAVVFSHLLKKLKLKQFDRVLGGALGAVKGFVVCAVAAVVISGMPGAWGEACRDSRLAGFVVAVADWARGKASERDIADSKKKLMRSSREFGDRLREKLSDEDDAP